MKTLAEVLLLLLLAGAPGPAPQLDPAEFAARDAHEGVTLVAKPYVNKEELKERFGAHPLGAAGIVAVEVLVVNERNEAIRVAWERAVLLVGEGKFELLEPEAIAGRIYPLPKVKPGAPWPEKQKRPPRDKHREARETLEAALWSQRMRVAVIPAGSRARGFLYFDGGEQPLELGKARLYVPEVVRLLEQQPLLYFEVDFKAYAKE